MRLKKFKPVSVFSIPFVLLLQCFTVPSFALQTKIIKDNGAAYATISTKEWTRISVDNDRILDIKGPSGIYIFKNDNAQGAVYMKPIPLQQAVDGAGNAAKSAAPLKPFSV